jgi:hypothetical protein
MKQNHCHDCQNHIRPIHPGHELLGDERVGPFCIVQSHWLQLVARENKGGH